jgi:hypothetical protein
MSNFDKNCPIGKLYIAILYLKYMSVITVELEIQTAVTQPSIADWSKALLVQEISPAEQHPCLLYHMW